MFNRWRVFLGIFLLLIKGRLGGELFWGLGLGLGFGRDKDLFCCVRRYPLLFKEREGETGRL